MALRDPKFNPERFEYFERYGIQHPEPGVFVAETLNLHLAVDNRDREDLDEPYGVCDSLEQLKTTQVWSRVVTDPRPLILILTPIRKSDQEPEEDWRWHKWGEYVGTQVPECEYLYDEPVIELVYVFSAVPLIK